jgi:very-short-patch-repair endonuclease
MTHPPEVPPPSRGRLGGGAPEGRKHLPLAQLEQTQERAQTLRKTLTDAEKKLWHCLRSKQLSHKFRRQLPFDDYIADFVCLELRLVVELDGGQHSEAIAYDAKRTAYFESQGFRVLRFWNHDVLSNIEGVVEVIASHIAPPPQPSPARGEGVSPPQQEMSHA